MLLDPLRNYCERTADHLWSEPLNAITNLSFLIAAWLLWKSYKAAGNGDRPVATLILLIALVGIGSGLFHTFANGLTMLADVIPISLFTFYYLWVCLRRLLSLGMITSIACLLLFAAISSQTAHIPPAYSFNGSVGYFPCLAALLFIGAYLHWQKNSAAKRLMLASGVFTVSLTLRSVDYMVCPAFPIGTHFLWHMLNGLMLYLLVSIFLRPSTSRQ